MNSLPFQGISVLDLSQGIAGPVCAAILARQGADVIKIEPPSGDWIRATGASREHMSSNAVSGNFNKRGLAIDAGSPAGRDAVLRLAARADVFVENFRNGVMRRLGLDFEALQAANPRLVYCSITGFGDDGPWAKKPATDSVVQAFSGMAVANALADGTPRRIGLYVPDNISAIYAAQAVSAALFARERDGAGRHVRISLAECCAAFQAGPMIDSFLFPDAGRKVAVFAPAGEFATADGHLVVACMSGDMFVRLARAVGRADWLTDPRYADDDVRKGYLKEINAELGAALAAGTSVAWLDKLEAADVLVSPVNDYRRLRDDPQMRAMAYFAHIDQPPYGALDVPHMPAAGRLVRPAPRVGEHTRAVLAEAGLAAAEIDALIAAGTAAQFGE
jgi:crotonobetainyl-CoA:carnitine CoA-transferase CaiB-like acyl-CoA transferase